MKKVLALVALLSAILLTSQPAGAVPILYEGALTSGVASVGSVTGNGWITSQASGVDFWSFFGNSGDIIDLTGSRLDEGLDPAFSLYFGTTGADESAYTSFADFGGLDFLLTRDDDIDVPGPFGDPFLNDFVLPQTGNYTVAIGGLASSGSGPFGYQLLLAGSTLPQEGGNPDQNVIPEPTTLMLLGSGLAGLVGFRRKIV